MKPHQVFGLAVRGLGLYFIFTGIHRLFQVFDVIIPLMGGGAHLEGQGRRMIVNFLLAGLLHFAVAAFFFLRAEWLVDVAYPPERGSVAPRTDGSNPA